ncbi:MAG: biopolymer transporter ExbD [Planctomycetota bacterium]
MTARSFEITATRRRRNGRAATSLAPRLASMIDVVFLLLMYFLLIAGFTKPESSLDAELAGEAPVADPFDLPPQPIDVVVRTTGTGPDAFALVVAGLPGDAVSDAEMLDAALASSDAVLSRTDQVFVVRAEPTTRWEHVLETFNIIRRRGYERVRFEEPK